MPEENIETSKLEKALEVLNLILSLVGNIRLKDAKEWTEAKINAQKLREEGHEKEK